VTKSNRISARGGACAQGRGLGVHGLLLADSQNLNADIWVELGLAGAPTSRLRPGPDVDLPSSASSTITNAGGSPASCSSLARRGEANSLERRSISGR
jgi:hypothetical protein